MDPASPPRAADATPERAPARSTRPQGVRGITGSCVLERDSPGEIEYLPRHMQAKDNALREEIT